MKRQISTVLTTVRLGMESIASNPVLLDSKRSDDEKKQEIFRLAQYIHFCSALTLLSPEGYVIECTDPSNTRDHDGSDWFLEAKNKGRTAMSRPMIDGVERQNSGKLVMAVNVYQPVIDASGKLLYVVKADMTFQQIWDLLAGAKVGDNGSFVLLDDVGNVLYHPKSDLIYDQKYDKLTGTDFNTLASGEYSGGRKAEMIFEAHKISKDETFTDRAWILITRLEKKSAMSFALQNRWTSVAVAVFSLLITILVGTWFASRIAKPVMQASQAARAVAAGDLNTKLEGKGASELGELAEAFNHMTYQVLQHSEKLELMVESRTRSLTESQERLSEMTAQLRAAYESTREGILVIHSDGHVIAANKQLEKLFGLAADEVNNCTSEELEKLLGQRLKDSKEFGVTWSKTREDEKVTTEAEWMLTSPQDRSLSVYTSPVLNQEGKLVARLWMFRDITEQRLLEDSLRHAQKMDAVGRLAGGVAHDFNNLLQGILGNLFIVQQDPGVRANEEIRICLHAARNAGQRAAELVKGLLGFSRQSHLHLGRCDVNEVLSEVERLIRPTFDPRITISLDLQDRVWGLHADSNQVEQVIMNMLVNAKDAMPNGGSLIVTTRNVSFNSDGTDLPPGALPGDYVRISVSDTGMGMSEEVRAKIFEPFFTTKEQGKGTGLGLATSFGIIEQHGGWISCDSVVGHGSTFHIFLPKNEVEAAQAKIELESPKPVGGRETILVVDDEMVVRAVAEAILKKHGYNILSASDGEEALDILAREDGLIDLVLMDMTMPRLSGMDTFRKMRKGLAPKVPVVICSGYLVDLSGFMADTGAVPNGFLQKPYDVEDMARTVRKVLDQAEEARTVIS